MPKKNKGNVGGEAIKVFVRVRPPISNEVSEENAVNTPSNTSVKLSSSKHNVTCSYDHVFSELTSQDDVFNEVQPLLVDVLAGYNACIFAYGQTSAGKTHTMLGPNGGTNLSVPKEYWGILPRSAEFVFSELENMMSKGNFRFTAKASFLQIYKEKLFDLLRGSGSFEHDDGSDADLKIREIPRLQDPVTGYVYKKDENRPSEVFITGLSEYRVQTASDVLKILALGTANRHTRSTNYNDTSSRSHALLQISFEIENKQTDGQTLLYRSKLSLVDLAGSEKMQSMEANLTSDHHLKELTSINKSLSCLGNVIASLSKKKRSHVPYRDSKLTRILQDSLGGNTRTILIACIAPTILHSSESVSTLQFADRARNVMLKAKANMVIDDKALLADAQTEIARLKLLLKQALQKIEQMSGSKNDSMEEVINDGETNEELNRVLKENKKLRRDNQALQKAIASLRLMGSNGSSHDVYIRGTQSTKGKRGKKAEWKSSMVDDEVYKKPKIVRKRGKNIRNNCGDEHDREIRTSQSTPLHIPPHIPPLYGIDTEQYENHEISLPGIKNASSSKRVHSTKRHEANYRYASNQALEDSDELKSAILAQVKSADKALYKSISTATEHDGKAVVVGSPSRSSMAAVRQEYENVVQDTGGNGDYEDDFDNEDYEDDESLTVDAKAFRQEIDKAKNSKQLKDLENKLDKASRDVAKELEEETSALNDIQSTRMELERQLKELQLAAAAENELENEDENKKPSSRRKAKGKSPAKSSNPKLDPTVTSKPVSIVLEDQSMRCSIPQSIASKEITPPPDPMTNLANIVGASTGGGKTPVTNDVKKTETVPSKPRTKSEVKNQHPPADLKYSAEDIGRRIELYSYKFATWDIVELVDFSETNGNMHKCKSESDKSEKWIDLAKKPIRGLPIAEL